MVYTLGNEQIDIDDTLLSEFEAEMQNISQDMIEACAKLALLKYNDIKTPEDFKRRVEDIMLIEMTRHRDIKETKQVLPGEIYDILGHQIEITPETARLFSTKMGYPLGTRRLRIYTSIVLQENNANTLSDKEISDKVTKLLKKEMAMYE